MYQAPGSRTGIEYELASPPDKSASLIVINKT